MPGGFLKSRLSQAFRGVALSLLLFFPLLKDASAQTPFESIQALDNAYYYPQREGLSRLQARVTWTQVTPFSGKKEYLTNPSVLFNWDGNTDKREFEIHPEEKDVSGERTLEILRLFRNYEELILPRPLTHKLKGYVAGAQKPSGKYMQMAFESGDSSNPIQKYFLLVDPSRQNIFKFRMVRRQAPRQVTVTFKYTRQANRWLVSESRAQFKMQGKNFQEVTEYKYGKVKNFWLPQQVSQTLHEENSVRHSNMFRLDEFRVAGKVRGERNPE